MSDKVALPDLPVHELPVKVKTVIEPGKIDSEGFIEEIEKFLTEGKHIWRSSGKMATNFKVDPVELHKFLSGSEKFVSKSSSEEGEILYALKSRLEEKKEKQKPVISEEDRYALSQLSLVHDMMCQTLKRFGIEIHTKCPEAFDYFVEGKSKLEIGLVRLAAATNAKLEKLE